MAIVKEHGGKQKANIDDSPFGRIAALMDLFGAIFKVVQPPAGWLRANIFAGYSFVKLRL